MIRWIGAADPVALDQREVERLGHDALAGEGGVAVDEDGQHREPHVASRAGSRSILARAMPSTTGLTASRCDGLAASSTGMIVAGATLEDAGLAQVVLHVARALDRVGIDVALELAEELLVGLADDVDQHVEPAAVRHARARRPASCSSAAWSRMASRMAMADSAPSSPKRFWPTHLVARNFSSASAALRRSRMWRCSSGSSLDGRALDLLLDPALLLDALDVGVLDADRAAVRVAQHVRGCRRASCAPCRRPAHTRPSARAGEELAVEVPDGRGRR